MKQELISLSQVDAFFKSIAPNLKSKKAKVLAQQAEKNAIAFEGKFKNLKETSLFKLSKPMTL